MVYLVTHSPRYLSLTSLIENKFMSFFKLFGSKTFLQNTDTDTGHNTHHNSQSVSLYWKLSDCDLDIGSSHYIRTDIGCHNYQRANVFKTSGKVRLEKLMILQ